MKQRIWLSVILAALLLSPSACTRAVQPRSVATLTPASLPLLVEPDPAPTPGPLAQTMPPVDWHPTPVPFDPWLPTGEAASTTEALLFDQLLAWLALHPGDYTGFNTIVAGWPAVQAPSGSDNPDDIAAYSYPEQYVRWVEQVDLDSDGQEEDIIALKMQQPSWAVLTHSGALYTVIYHSNPWLYHGLAEFVSGNDITCDGRPDAIVLVGHQSTLSVGQTMVIGNWDGTTWRIIGQIAGSGNSPSDYEVALHDADNDGCMDVLAQTYPVNMYLSRLITSTYSLVEGVYQETAITYAPSDFAVFQTLDANRALARGDLDQALRLAYLAMADPDRGDVLPSFPRDSAAIYQARIVSYAAIEAMLVHLLRGDSADARSLLERLRSQYDRADNPFVPAAQTLWDTYQAGGDVAAACAAMEEAVRLRGDALLLPYTSERLEMEQVCPLD